MKHLLTLFFVLFANLSLAQGSGIPPFYWGIEKNERARAADAQFIEDTAEKYTDGRKEAALVWVDQAWSHIKDGNPELAVRRFNEAWLLDPRNQGVPYGLMIATHIRGDSDQTVEKLFEMALFAMPAEDQFIAYLDYSRVLVEREQAEAARELLETRIAETTETDLRPYYEFLAVACQALEDEACFDAASAMAQ